MTESLIDTVTRLNELEGRRQAILAREKESGNSNRALKEKVWIEIDMLKVFPAMLDVLGEIRAGDAEKMQSFIDAWECIYGKIEVLHRYRDIAARMEATK
ncbi:MAG: hypothetical protein PHS46_07900 [Candidatus Omnitrophica bacterium]|nr:hypothetical protein [Candidatus Omnitrophota bacterium]